MKNKNLVHNFETMMNSDNMEKNIKGNKRFSNERYSSNKKQESINAALDDFYKNKFLNKQSNYYSYNNCTK